MQQALNRSQSFFLYVSAILLSGILTAFAVSHRSVLNADGLCYLLSAEQFTQSGLKQAMQLCGQAAWPFYSVLLAMIARVSTLPLEHTAFVLNAMFDATSVLFFVMIIRVLTPNPRIALLGLLTILCAHDFNSVRDIVVRDHGYWMGYLASLYFFLRYAKEKQTVLMIAFSLSILIASLFRIEGLVFFFLVPLSTLLLPGTLTERLKSLLLCYVPHALIVGVALIALFFFADQLTIYSGRLPDALSKIQQSVSLIVTHFQAAKTNLLQHVLTIEAARDATLVMALLLIVWYLVTVITQFSLLYTGLFFVSMMRSVKIAKRNEWVILLTYLAINVLITSSFFAIYFFLSKRYLMAQSFILMLCVPFAINYLFEKKGMVYKKTILLAVFAWMLLANQHVFYASQDSHRYLQEAGQWVAKFVPQQDTFYTNDEFVLYYSGLSHADFFKTMTQYQVMSNAPSRDWHAFHYAAINTKLRGANVLLNEIKAQNAILVRQFVNPRHEQVLIYQMNIKEGRVV